MAEPEGLELPEPNLTPMIDVVFQLVIFLLMANDLTRRDLAELELAAAPHSLEDRQAAGRLTVNLLPGAVDAEPALRLRGEPADLAALHRALLAARAGAAPPSVLLRADRRTPWRHVRLVLQASAARGADVHRVEFAATAGGGTGAGPATAGGAR